MCVCSLRYHALHPTYLFERLKELGKNYKLRVLLVLVDMVRRGGRKGQMYHLLGDMRETRLRLLEMDLCGLLASLLCVL